MIGLQIFGIINQALTSMSTSNALFLGTPADKSYLPYLKGMFAGVPTYVCLEDISLLTHLEMYCSKKGITKVVSTNIGLLKNLLGSQGNLKDKVSLADYAGSLFVHKNLEIVFVAPLAQLFTVSYGKFLCQRYISKVVAPESWHEPTEFKWSILSPDSIEAAYAHLSDAFAIAVDIETIRRDLAVSHVSYTGVYIGQDGRITTATYVLKIEDLWCITWMRKLNELPVPKIFQNGKYDNSYFLRFNSPITNWTWDTAHLFHCWYSELPKDLAFLNAFFLRKVVYWKDLSETTDPFEFCRYNAMDGWATANVFIQWILTAPDWAKHNYTLEFPLVFPCLLAEMTGLIRDSDRLLANRAKIDKELETKNKKLQTSLGAPGFNSNSPLQVQKLLRVLGLRDVDSSDEKTLKKASFLHPLNAYLCGLILDIRGLRKMASTYLRTDDDAKTSGIHAGEGGSKEYRGTTLYALNPHGTDTGRLASREHHFWCGLQIQNIPSRDGPTVKETFRAPDGFFIGEADLEQAESRDTAHIAGDERLIAAVTGSRDFHSINASAFFGVPYDSIYDDSIGKTKNKPLRDLAKRVNHGANYNMGPLVLVETMGLDKIWEAKKLLKLPFNEPKDIAQYLLDKFHGTYPKLRGPTTPFSPGTFYASIANEVTVSRKIVSRAYHHTAFNLSNYSEREYIERGDWTRYCFGDPIKNKLDLNSYVAHAPQSLNSRTLNEAWMRVFYEVALPNPTTFRLHAQIHDSILFSYADGRHDHAEAVRRCMEIPVTVRDVSGTYRTFTVPASLKAGKQDKLTGELIRARYWSETE